MLLIATIPFIIGGCAIEGMKIAEESIPFHKDYDSDKPVVLFILDTSGSMNDVEADGKSRMSKAKESIIDTISQIDGERFNTSLITFNGRRKCQPKVAIGPNNNPDRIIKEINNIKAKGATPLAKAIRLSDRMMSNIHKKMIILLSDGEETCRGNPVLEAQRLHNKHGTKINFQVIGYAVDQNTREELEQISNINKSWAYHEAKDKVSLDNVIDKIVKKHDIRDKSVWVDSRHFAFEFNTGSTELKEEYVLKIDKMYNYLKHNNKGIIIVGHTDSIGSDEANMELSIGRAEIVKSKLVELGIDAGRIQATGEGEINPVASNDTEDGRRENRRVEIEILD